MSRKRRHRSLGRTKGRMDRHLRRHPATQMWANALLAEAVLQQKYFAHVFKGMQHEP